MANETPEMSCKTCHWPLDDVVDNRCPGCNLTFYREHPGSYLHDYRICCPSCEHLLSVLGTTCPGCGHEYSYKRYGTYVVGTRIPKTQRIGWLASVDLHVLYSHLFSLVPSSGFAAGFAHHPRLKASVGLVFAGATVVATLMPGSFAVYHLLEGWRFKSGGRWRYALANGAVLAAGTAWLAWLCWRTP